MARYTNRRPFKAVSLGIHTKLLHKKKNEKQKTEVTQTERTDQMRLAAYNSIPLFAISYHSFSLKNVKNTNRVMLLSVKVTVLHGCF